MKKKKKKIEKFEKFLCRRNWRWAVTWPPLQCNRINITHLKQKTEGGYMKKALVCAGYHPYCLLDRCWVLLIRSFLCLRESLFCLAFLTKELNWFFGSYTLVIGRLLLTGVWYPYPLSVVCSVSFVLLGGTLLLLVEAVPLLLSCSMLSNFIHETVSILKLSRLPLSCDSPISIILTGLYSTLLRSVALLSYPSSNTFIFTPVVVVGRGGGGLFWLLFLQYSSFYWGGGDGFNH